jgi:hypothetical protein
MLGKMPPNYTENKISAGLGVSEINTIIQKPKRVG